MLVAHAFFRSFLCLLGARSGSVTVGSGKRPMLAQGVTTVARFYYLIVFDGPCECRVRLVSLHLWKFGMPISPWQLDITGCGGTRVVGAKH